MDAAASVFDAMLPLARLPSVGALPPLEVGQRRIVLARNGVFIEAMSRVVHACVSAMSGDAGHGLGLGVARPFVRFLYGAIPEAITKTMAVRARALCPSEWAGLVVFERGQYRLVEPQALARSAGHVRYDSVGVDPLSVAMDVHSHGRGASYFSGTDDADDRRNPSPCFVAGVIGHAGADQTMSWCARAVVHGRFHALGGGMPDDQETG